MCRGLLLRSTHQMRGQRREVQRQRRLLHARVRQRKVHAQDVQQPRRGMHEVDGLLLGRVRQRRVHRSPAVQVVGLVHEWRRMLDRLDREELDDAPKTIVIVACALLVACSSSSKFTDTTADAGVPDTSDDGATLGEGGGDEPPSCTNLECQDPELRQRR